MRRDCAFQSAFVSDLQQKEADKQREVARTLARGMSSDERAALAAYVDELSRIRTRKAHPMVKAKHAWAATLSSEVTWPVARTILDEIKRYAWDERGIKGRAGIASSVAALAVFGSQGAGIAALGGAIGVPLWLVFGAGGAFLAGLYEELNKEGSGGETQPPRHSAPSKRPPEVDVVDLEMRPVPDTLGSSVLIPAPVLEKRLTLRSGDFILCLACSHERMVSQAWLDAISTARGSDSISRYGLQATDIERLKCVVCGAKTFDFRQR